MKVELQGEGTYEYTCELPGCWFCEYFNPAPYTHLPIPEKRGIWNVETTQWLIDNYNNYDTEFCASKLKCSLSTVRNKLYKLREEGYYLPIQKRKPNSRGKDTFKPPPKRVVIVY